MSKKKIIEDWIPLYELSASAMGDKAHKGHPGNLHLWWNRSPIDSSAAILFAALSNDDDEEAQELVAKVSKSEAKSFQDVRAHINEKTKTDKLPIVVDPFSGFGGLTIASEKIGMKTDSGDLNALATLLTKVAAEIPAGFECVSPVHPGSHRSLRAGNHGLAEDTLFYGKKIGEEASEILKKAYPEESGSVVFSWVWVRSIECANPACKAEMPLSNGFVLSKKKGKEYWAEPILEDGKTTFRIHNGICPKEKSTNKVGSMGAKFSCPFCREIVTDEYVKQQGKDGKIRNLLMAVAVDSMEGRDFYVPSVDQTQAANQPFHDDLLAGDLPNNTRWFSTPAFGMTKYKDLYTERQLKLMCTLSDLIHKYRDIIIADARNAGMSDDNIELSVGGKGAFAYGQAVSVYLSLVLGRMTNYQSSICTWDNRKGNLRAAFTRQAIPMTWTFAEGNPFSGVTGNYDSCLMNVVESIRNLPCSGGVRVTQADGITRDYPKNSILFTELPYLDNVGYADLSDYFYIWLRKCLIDVYPELFEKIVTSKEELSSIPEHYDGDAQKGRKAYSEGLRKLFLNFSENASDEYPSMVFYEYSRSDEIVIKQEGSTELSTWEEILQSIIDAGFQITRVWPIRTEKENDRFESIRVLIVFRKRKSDADRTTRRSWVNILRKELPLLLDADYSHEVDEADKPIIAMGRGLAIFTQYEKILNANGSGMNVHDALQLIYQETEDYFIAHSSESHSDEIIVKEG